jgi:Glycerol uptake facilitator and related permeases (Major Intrinsic Protein Family)
MGDGVVANVVLNKTKGNNSGWIVITLVGQWLYSLVCMYPQAWGSGHLNPAVTIAMVAFNNFDATLLPTYILAQFAGAISGAILVWLAYKQHFDSTDDKDGKLAVFCNAPAIRGYGYNLITEIIGTFILVLGALAMSKPASTLGTLDALPVGLLVLGIGLSLGGPTGYAINPARDLGPRIAHFILPIKNKRDSDWGYSWIPVVGPIIGGLIAAYLFKLI